MREYENYREILADLLQAKDGKYWTQSEVSIYLGIDRKTVKRKLDIGRGGIEVHDLARRISKEMRR